MNQSFETSTNSFYTKKKWSSWKNHVLKRPKTVKECKIWKKRLKDPKNYITWHREALDKSIFSASSSSIPRRTIFHGGGIPRIEPLARPRALSQERISVFRHCYFRCWHRVPASVLAENEIEIRLRITFHIGALTSVHD